MMNIKNKTIGIWGLGVVGTSAIRFCGPLTKQLLVMTALEPTSEQKKLLKQHGASWYLESEAHNVFKQCDYVLASPGIDTSVYASYEDKLICELDLFTVFWKKKIIAITGTVGKTTVTHLLSQLIEHAGISVATGGNIGTPMLDLISQQDTVDYALLELSSFQLERVRSLSPDIAVITNFYENHLDRHKTLRAYAQAKQNIFVHQIKSQQLLLPEQLIKDELFVPKLANYKGTLYVFSPDKKKKGEYKKQLKTKAQFYGCRHNKRIIRQDTQETIIAEFTQPPTITHEQNWLVIITILHLLNINCTQLTTKFNNLSIHPDRLEYLGTFNGCHVYNDSKATVPQATLQACSTFSGSSIILFLGGLSKGIDRSSLVAQLPKNISHVVCFGSEAQQLATWCRRQKISVVAYKTLEESVKACKAMLVPDTVVLFSPSGASFDLFVNYHQRGNAFKELVKKYLT